MCSKRTLHIVKWLDKPATSCFCKAVRDIVTWITETVSTVTSNSHFPPYSFLVLCNHKDIFWLNVMFINHKQKKVGKLTNTWAINLLVSNAADASSQRDQPITISSTEQLGCVSFFSMVDACSPHLHQRGGIHPRYCVWKWGQVPQCEWTFLIVNSHWNQGYAGTNVLECQIEALPGHGSNLAHLCVELEDAISEIHLSEALISSDGVNLGVLGRLEFDAMSLISLVVEEVEGLLAGARHPRNGVAIPQSEAKLHVNLLSRLSRDPVGTKPVVLIGLHHIAHLEGMDGSVVLIHLRDGIPLKRK